MERYVDFVVHTAFKDGTLAERMAEQELNSELKSAKNSATLFLYRCKAELLRALVSAGCQAEIVNDVELFQYIHNITLIPAEAYRPAPETKVRDYAGIKEAKKQELIAELLKLEEQ